MTTPTGVLASEFSALYTDAYDVLREARQGRSIAELDARVQAILEVFEEEIGSLSAKAGRSLRRWATELAASHLTLAGVHLDRAGAALGLSPSALRQVWEEHEEAWRSQSTRRAPASERAPVPSPPRRVEDEEALASLNARNRSLVELLPPPGQALEGAAALAHCWGGAMSPTSARGRYSRLASMLRSHCGREMLLRGQGRYGRIN